MSRAGAITWSEVKLVGRQRLYGATKLLASTRIGPEGQSPPVSASKFWIWAEPWSALTQMQSGRNGSRRTV